MAVHARTSPARLSPRRRTATPLRVVGFGAALLILAGVGVGLVFAGSPLKIAAGVRVAGVNVGGLSQGEARTLLERRSDALVRVPVVFTAAGHTFRISPDSLGVRVDWKTAVSDARRQGEGFGPLRGFKRLDVRVFGAEVAPPTSVFRGALDLQLAEMAKAVNRPHREPALRIDGLRPVVVPPSVGRVLDKRRAATLVVRALSGFERAPVALPVVTDPPALRAPALAPAAAQLRRALSGPVRLTLGPTRFKLPRWRIAELLELPAEGRTALQIGGPAADAWLARLAKKVARPATDATFSVNGSNVRIVPDEPGLTLDAAATKRALLRASVRRLNRVAPIAVVEAPANRTTADARAMGITGLVSGYTTAYGGIANRIHNVQLVARLVDNTLIGPGKTFSFNGTTGERTAAKGFLEAPVIVNGELQTGLGGGICQVSTTVFNAAFEAGLRITERTNHALYISHYPQGRDATVNYPDLDLKFVNDTDSWLLLRTFVGASQLTVNLYGTPQHRKVESATSPLRATGAPRVKKTVDPTLEPGEKVIDSAGSPSLATSVERKVYDSSGKLLYDNVWYSSYRGEPQVIRVGPKKKPADKKKPKSKNPTAETPGTVVPTPTTPVQTTPAPTTPTQTTTAPAETTPQP